jgi:putative thiamine transport system permease protein
VVAAIGLWRGLEKAVVWCAGPWLVAGARGGSGLPAMLAAWTGIALLLGLALGRVFSLAAWSVAGPWRFPDAWPRGLMLDGWEHRLLAVAQPTWTTLTIGLATTLVALLLVLGCLENESRQRHIPGRGILTVIYLPLLAPQIGFLFGVQLLLVRIGLDGTYVAVVWAHLMFVLPYVFLTLADPYRSLDPRYARSALALGKPPWVVWWRVKLVMLLRPLLIAAAVGFAVSAAQYVPTLFAGGGRIATLTTDALSLASGGNRRTVGVIAFTLAMLPLLGFALAIGAPAWRFRQRRALRVAA